MALVQFAVRRIADILSYMKEPKIAAKKSIPVEVEEGKKYFFCACGSSQNQPFCDGAHSGTEFGPIAFTAEKTGTAYFCQCKRSGKVPYCDGTHNSL
jgi:CDGSH-type Zn-finger protein|tara:strand:+ start:605 stop:895 length:291 start_codon:yes stop_codon:yes gene_type:complete